MSSPDTSMPDSALIEGLNTPTAPDTITSDSTQSQIPAPDQSSAPTQPQADPSAPQQQQAPQSAPRPSLWKSVLSGALQGLAAGGSVNTRGMSGGQGFAAGAAAGANQVLNVVPAQKSAQQQADIQNAFHHAQLAQIQREMALAPKDKHEQYLDNAATTYNEMLKSGGAVPLTPPGDFATAQQAYQASTLKNPAMTYSIMPTGRDENGDFLYSAVQYPNGLTQKDITLTDPDGNKVTVPAGTKSSSVGQVYTNMVAKTLDRDSKESIASQNNATKTAIATENNQTKVQTAATRAATAGAGTNVVAFDPDYQNTDGSKGANVVLDKATATQRGLFNYKADPTTINSTVGGMNDVQNKLNSLAAVVNDTKRMQQVDPKLAAAMLNPTTGVNLSFGGHGGGASAGIGLATDRINAWLNNANVKDANQATRDYVANFLGAHEAITQLPRLQTFGKSSRMTETQLHAALNLLPQPGDDAAFAQQKMENLQTMIDPLRKQMPHMHGAELIPSWLEQKQKPPAATHVFDPTTNLLNFIGGQQ